jgi:sugar phosphate isomerase/epimerase
MLEAGAELGARLILAVSHDPDEGRTAAALGALAESAAGRGLGVALEFMGFTEVKTAAAAARVVALASHPALGILADSLHLARSGGSAADLAGLPLVAAQLCDGPAEGPSTPEGLAAEARTARLMPGAGGLRLGGFVAALPSGVPVSLEVPSAAGEDPMERAARGRAALRAFGL